MNERLKQLRKILGLTQQDFADRIGIKRNSFANYETGRNTPMDAILISICREFNVREEWLRTGEGEMFLTADRNSDIAKLTKQLLNEESDSFKNRFISMLSNLSSEEWELLEQKTKELYEGVSNTNIAAALEPEEDVNELEEEYKKRHLHSVSKKKLLVSSSGNAEKRASNT